MSLNYLIPLSALLAIMGCSKKDDAKNRCCTDADLNTISSHPNYTFLPPNVITPNGDGLNDKFGFIAFDNSSTTPTQLTFGVQRIAVYRQETSAQVFQSTTSVREFDGLPAGQSCPKALTATN